MGEVLDIFGTCASEAFRVSFISRPHPLFFSSLTGGSAEQSRLAKPLVGSGRAVGLDTSCSEESALTLLAWLQSHMGSWGSALVRRAPPAETSGPTRMVLVSWNGASHLHYKADCQSYPYIAHSRPYFET